MDPLLYKFAMVITFNAAGCLGCLSMLMVTLDAAGCLDAQVVTRCTKGFIWMLKMTMDAAGCLGCLLMHKLSLDAPTHFYQCSWWPSLQLDVLDVYQCTSCALMHQHIFIDFQDNPWYIWMCFDVLDCSLMYLDASWSTWLQLDVPGCILMHLLAAWCTWMSIDAQVVPWYKITLDMSGCALMYFVVA